MAASFARGAAFLWAVLLGLPWPVAAGIGGYYKIFFMGYDVSPGGWEGTVYPGRITGAVRARLRLEASWSRGEFFSWEGAYELEPLLRERPLRPPPIPYRLDPYSLRIADPRLVIYPRKGTGGNFTLAGNLDRFYATLSFSTMDLYVGRQAIAWGSARAVNPTDVVSPFPVDEIDTEDRVGVDAVRIRFYPAPLAEVEGGAVAGETWLAGAAYIRGRVNLGGFEFSALALGFRRHLLAGIDISGSQGGSGYWLEAAQVFSGTFGGRTRGGYLRLSAGMDRALGPNGYGFWEYHFNGAGAGDPSRYGTLFKNPAYCDGSVYLLGRHYLALGGRYQITPLFLLETSCFLNLSDRSLFFAPRFRYSLSDEVLAEVGAYSGWGEGSDSPGVWGSEFGSYPRLFYASIALYF